MILIYNSIIKNKEENIFLNVDEWKEKGIEIMFIIQ